MSGTRKIVVKDILDLCIKWNTWKIERMSTILHLNDLSSQIHVSENSKRKRQIWISSVGTLLQQQKLLHWFQLVLGLLITVTAIN